MKWGVKSLIWGVLSNRVCRDTKGVYIEPLMGLFPCNYIFMLY